MKILPNEINKKSVAMTIVHLAFWSGFLLLPFIFSSHPNPHFAPPQVIILHRRLVYLFSGIMLVAFFYTNTLLLIPQLLFKKRWWPYLMCVLLLFVLFMNLPEKLSSLLASPSEKDYHDAALVHYREHLLLDSVPSSHQAKQGHLDWSGKSRKFRFFPDSYWIFILLFTISTCLSLLQQWLRAEQKAKEIEREKLNTELNFLKSQINPHFFFNTLNNIYSLAVVGSEETAPVILQLSNIMRYILSEAQQPFVSLVKEVNFIRHYIEIQKVRLTDKVSVSFSEEGDFNDLNIAPLIFIPFVENAFKYGISTKSDSTISIKLVSNANKVTFDSFNTVAKNVKNERTATGIGITNVKRRLMLLYAGKHELSIKDQPKEFTVHLEIILK